MKKQSQYQNQTPLLPLTTAAKHDFQSRPFSDPVKPALNQAEVSNAHDLQAQAEQAAQHGHNFSCMQVNAMPVAIQTKLTIGQTGDRYEQEADRIADQIVNTSAIAGEISQVQTAIALPTQPTNTGITPIVQQMGIAGLGEEEIRRQPDLQPQATENTTVDPHNLEQRLNQSRGSGSPLPNEVRARMEQGFGFNFNQVRIHTDNEAVQMNRELNAQAFTHKHDIYFAAGKYRTDSRTGQHLLAHELTHVVQQMSGTLSNQQVSCSPENPETREQDAQLKFEAGSAAYAAGNYAEALEKFQSVYGLLETRQRAAIAYDMGVCHQRLGQFDDAIAIYQEYLSFPGIGGRSRALTLEQIRRARSGETEIATEPPQATAEEHAESREQAREAFAQGEEAFRAENFAEALDFFTQAYADPNLEAAIRQSATFNMAVCQQRLGEFDAAISLYEEYTQFSGTNDARRRETLERIRQCRSGATSTDTDTTPDLSVEEARALFEQASHTFSGGNYAEALDLFNQIYAAPNTAPRIRRSIVYDMGVCYQRLQQFEQAIAMWQEYLIYPGLSDRERQATLDKIQQARQGQVGTQVHMGDPSSEDPSSLDPDTNERFLMQGDVFFETGSAQLSREGVSTINSIATILQEQHQLHPTATFRLAVIGQSSRRWQNSGDSDAQALNQALSSDRATVVANVFNTTLPSQAIQSGIYSINLDATGSEQFEVAGFDADDNTWHHRTTQIIVWMRESSGSTP